MTEKRFKLSEPNGAYLIDGDKPLFHLDDSDDKIVELLNSLNDENEQLKEENKQLKQALKMEEEEAEVYNLDAMNYQTLYEQQKKKNEQLKRNYADLETSMNICRNARNVYSERITELEKENEQLKLLIAFIKQMKKCDCKSCPVDEYIQKLIE